MEGEKRFNMGPVPSRPEFYINETQVSGLSVLRKFGWKLVCIRRPSIDDITTILRNSYENSLGVLGKDGILRISENLKVRSSFASVEPVAQVPHEDQTVE
jgi:hypothetical protein